MAISWFICTYKRSPGRMPGKYCAMNDFTGLIRADDGDWLDTEVLGGYALVKVRASETTLANIAAEAGFLRIPLGSLGMSLANLTAQQRTAIRERLNAMGYTDTEIIASLGNNLAQRTLGDVLRFAASRRREQRYDAVQDILVLDGEIRACFPVDQVDQKVAS